MPSQNEYLQGLFHRYREEVGVGPTSLRIVASWLIANGYWKLHPSAEVRQCADQLAKALRDEFFTDAQGRRVRAKHAVRIPKKEEG